MSEKWKKKEKNKVLIGCILYYAVSMGMIGMTNASYGLFPDTYHISVSALGTVSVVCPLFYMLSAAAFSRLERWLGLRGMCFLGAAVVAGMGFSLGCLKGLAAVICMYILQGVIVGATSIVLTSTILMRCYSVGIEKKLSLVLGAGILGSAAFQWIAGPLYEAAGFQRGYLLFCVCAAVVQILAAVCFLDIGRSRIRQAAETAGSGRKAGSLYRDKVFWLCAAGRILGNAGTGYTCIYATLHFADNGMPYPVITTILGVMTLASGLFSFLNGKLIEKITLRRFFMLTFGSAMLCSILLAGYPFLASAAVIVLIIAVYAIGAPTANASVLSVNNLFAPDEITKANSLLYAFGGLGCMGFNPLCGAVAGRYGYSVTYIMLAVFTGVSLLFYLAAVRSRHRP